MRGIAHKALLVVQQVLQPQHHLVGGVHQWLQFAGGIRRTDGGELVLRAGLQLFAQPAHRPGGALHHHHHHHRNDRNQDGLALQRVPQYLAGKGVAQLQRFRDLDDGHATALSAGHRLQQHGHTYILVPELRVIKIHQRRERGLVRNLAAPERQLCITRHHLAVEAGDPVVHMALVVGLEGLQRRVGHQGAQFRGFVIPFHVQLLADRFGGRQQSAVIGRIDGAEGLAVEAHGVEDHKDADGQQDAAEQVAPQGQRTGPDPHVSAFSR